MLKIIIFILLSVYYASAINTFIGNNKRAEIFELTDNEIAVFNIFLPKTELVQLKRAAQYGNIQINTINTSFKTKNATLIVDIKGIEKVYDKVTFSLGGSSSRSFGKQGYNLKIRGKEDLFGRTHLRLRPDAREATYLRSKLVCDIHNRLGLPSISANFATLYINDEFMGFYVLLDAFKLSWVEHEYNEKDTTTLYQCKDLNNYLTVQTSSKGCTNENEEVTNHSEWIDFLTRLDAAQSAEEIEDFFDIDQFLKEIAFEYLSGSWDHYLNYAHNFYMYKPKNDKWKFLLYDFDGEFGQDIANGTQNQRNPSDDYPNYTFRQWARKRHLIDILIINNSTRFDNIVRNFVTEAFNPTVLFPHIDELKEFIRPYVVMDKTPNKNGKYPGRLNERSGDYSFAQWDANCEFTSIRSTQGAKAYGLKFWILAKYRFVCRTYNIECDPYYTDENYKYSIDENVEFKTKYYYPFYVSKTQTQSTTTATTESIISTTPPTEGIIPSSTVDSQLFENTNISFQTTTTTTIASQSTTTETMTITPSFEITVSQSTTLSEPTETSTSEIVTTTSDLIIPTSEALKPRYNCWLEYIGSEFSCCDSGNTDVYFYDGDGEWGFNFETQEWCGLSPYIDIVEDKECWSLKQGYSCCRGCKVQTKDEYGKWGIENNEWCGIQSYCSTITL
ncbi:hypothetical protein BCR36DRAFT_415602 [Piromyces finnis]|uniref:CBM10 domain-containing protein n=1 Tax=Piromyces finnis TaxID=1754191 RepID=A0A1Y1UYL9_9FUNG|nr:hypothetical protein BCR36DRAFT_415602 [Piromyces finnis]|eukprot:ORX43422.1 hypothetical protein BCR36DRAFT_415602 [Piromyces finnis]